MSIKNFPVSIQLKVKFVPLGAKTFDVAIFLYGEFHQQEKQNPICLPDSTNYNQLPLNKETFVQTSQCMPDIKSFPMSEIYNWCSSISSQQTLKKKKNHTYIENENMFQSFCFFN